MKVFIYIIAICLSVTALAGTLTRPYTSADYAGGQRAIGSKINSEFDTIANFINNGNIASNNITVLGVTTSNIASGAITRPKLTALGLVTSSLTGTSTTSLLGKTNTGISVSLTTTGRPVFLAIQPRMSAGFTTSPGNGYMKASSTVVANPGAQLIISRDGTGICFFPMEVTQSSVFATNAAIVPAAFSCVDKNPTGDAHTYTVEFMATTSSTTATIDDIELVAFEL